MSSQRIEEWTSHLPYQVGLNVTQSTDKVYYSTEWSILQIDKSDFSTERISKVEGLSDIGIHEISFDSFNSQLFIAYNNGNIDVLTSQGTINLPNILSNNDLTGNKQINNIHVADENFTYLATGFGVVQISSKDLLFGFTSFTNIPVNDVTTLDDKIYISTDEGIYFARTDGTQNLIDFSLWRLLGEEVGLPSLYSSSSVTHLGGRLHFIADNILYNLENDIATSIYNPPDGSTLHFLSVGGSVLMIGIVDQNSNGNILFYDGINFTESGPSCTDRISDVIQDQNGRIWYADEFRGFRTAQDKESTCEQLFFDSPFSHEISDIALKGADIYVASGGVRDNFDYQFTRNGYYINRATDWTNFHQDNIPFIKENELLNFLTILPHPEDEVVFIGTYWGGLLRHDLFTDEFVLFNDSNSALLGTIGDEQRERVTGLAFDTENNLWVSSFGSSAPLAVLTDEGEWYNFSLSDNNNLINLSIDESGNIWMPAFGNNGGCHVYNPGDDITSSHDDITRFITSSDSELTTNLVNSVAVDLDGAVWVGTGEGPVVFDCGNDPFDRVDCQGVRIKVVQNSIVAFLLADQDILSIAVDGANQKWFGTRNGIFVQSPDGEEQIYRFTESNSPLFDNRIRDMAYNGISGEMVIGSDKGVQSFRTRSTEGANFHNKSNVLVYPNPVEPFYRGPIAIKGLVRDAIVQITDINGNLVSEIRAHGGQAIWDGKDQKGRDVSTGVYLIFSTNDSAFDSPDAFATKVMVIR